MTTEETGENRKPDPLPAGTQFRRYGDFYGKLGLIRKVFRFDVRFRCRRLQEVLTELHIKTNHVSVLDFGFGAGDLLKTFPHQTSICGVDVSPSAIRMAEKNPIFEHYQSAKFFLVPENDAGKIPLDQFDIVMSSHVIEHVDDDLALLAILKKRLKDDGHLVLIAPIEEPNYIPFHVRNYSLDTLRQTVEKAGFEVIFSEGSMHINGHIWKVITIPSRRNWPVINKVIDAFRLATLSTIPYSMVKVMDASLSKVGCGPRQGMIVAKKALPLSAQ